MKAHLPRGAAVLALAILAALAVSAVAEEYDVLLEWQGPYFRAVRSPQDQETDTPVVDVPFFGPYSVAAREHDGRDVVYVLDAGNRRVQAFEVNATFEYVTDDSLFYRASGSPAAAEWNTDEIRLPEWRLLADRWVVPRSEELSIDGSVWTWVPGLGGFTAADEVYTIDYDAFSSAPTLLFPALSLNSETKIHLSYLISDNQTGAGSSYGIGEVDYGIGEGLSPVLTLINEASGGPPSFQSLRGIALIENETTSTSDDIFVVDYADNSLSMDEGLFYYTVDTDGSVSFSESFGDELIGPHDVAVARSGQSYPPTVTISSDGGLFGQATPVIVDPNQVTGHSYSVTLLVDDIIITDTATGRVLVSQIDQSRISDPYYGIPGLELDTQIPTESITVSTTRARTGRYIFVAEADADRITVISAADGSSFSGDWLPLDVRSVITQPIVNVGGFPDEDSAESTPVVVPPSWTHWTVAYPVAVGSLDSLAFELDGTWLRVNSLTTAGPSDKVFEVDAEKGRVKFGDGTNGALPPAAEEFKYNYAVTPLTLRYGSSGSGDGEFNDPRGIAARWNSSVGGFDVYVADTGNDRVQKLRFYEEDPALGLLARMEYVTEWSTASGPSDPLSGPADVVVQADGGTPARIWLGVADTGNDRIVLYHDLAAAAPGGAGTDPPAFDGAFGSSGATLGGYQLPVGLGFLPNGTDLDVYVVDAARDVVVKYEEAPDPTIEVDWLPTECYALTSSYTVSFSTLNPPDGGYVDFYFDTVPTFNPVTARLALPSGAIPSTASSAVWVFADTPSGTPEGDTYYLFARLFNAGGVLRDMSVTEPGERVCLDPLIAPTVAIRDAFDGDSTLSLQGGVERTLRLAVAYPDSVVAAGFEGSFNPALLEVASITRGTAWDGIGANSVLFNANYDNVSGTFEVSSSALDTPIGLSGEGPYIIANVVLRLRDNVLDLETRFVDTSIHLEAGGSSLTRYDNSIPADLLVQDLAVRAGYLGDLATTGEGAEGEVLSFAPNPDGYIGFEDVMAFTLGWNGAGFERDPISDIGPALGTPPLLESNPDGLWNIDDVLVLTQMFSWAGSMGFGGAGVPAPRPADDSGLQVRRDAPASEPGILVDVDDLEWEAGRPVTVDVRAQASARPLGVRLVLEFPPGAMTLAQAEPGGFLLGSEGQLFMDRSGPGWIELTGARLGDRSLAPDAEPFVRLHLLPLRSGAPTFRFHYEMQDEAGRPLAHGATPWTHGPAAELRLLSGGPNPTPGPSRIEFELGRAAPVQLRILDVTGRTVRVLADRPMAAGRHEIAFNGRTVGGWPLAAGVYFARLEANGSQASRKLLIVR